MKIKTGMGGSNGGKSRRMGTEALKAQSKKPRRQLGKREILRSALACDDETARALLR